MVGADVIRWTRYCDMVSFSDAARTTRVTRLANRDRLSAACPAEFAPPTTKTSSPSHWAASLALAP